MVYTLVFPVFNESSCLEKNIKTTIEYLDKQKIDYEIIIAEDGSTDNTYEIGLKLSKEHKKVRINHYDEKLGRGLALKKAFSKAKGEYVGYMDIDLATDIKHIIELLNYVKNYDVVTGSRYLKSSITNRSVKRRIFSWVYNFLARLFFNSIIYDHQCGFKAFKKEVVLKLNEISKDSHWFWDTEILILAQKQRYRLKEFPVEWIEKKRTKVKAPTDSYNMIFNLLKLRVNL